MTADAACRGIREHDADGSIGLVGAESHPPYDRPPLSKALWQGQGREHDLARHRRARRRAPPRTQNRLARPRRAHVRPTTRATSTSTSASCSQPAAARGRSPAWTTRSTSARSTTTGASAELSRDGGRFVVVGGGFIGSEIAAALKSNGADVTMLFPDDGICARLFPASLSSFVTDYYREQGVEVLAGERVHAGDPTARGHDRRRRRPRNRAGHGARRAGRPVGRQRNRRRRVRARYRRRRPLRRG